MIPKKEINEKITIVLKSFKNRYLNKLIIWYTKLDERKEYGSI
jgi:hypothetical protein